MTALHCVRLVLFSCLLSLPCRADITNGLRAYYPFSNGLGNDYSGNSLSAALKDVSATADQRGSAGNAGLFNGSTSGAEVASTFAMTSQQTITAWIKPTGAPARSPIVEKAVMGYALEIDYEFALEPDRRLYWLVITEDGNVAQCYSTTAVPLNQWTHVAAVIDRAQSRTRLYVNGVLESTASMGDRDVRNRNRPFRIGYKVGNQAARYFTGAIDEVRVYERVLSSAEIAEVIASPSPTLSAGLAAMWSFDDGTANDSTAGRHHGIATSVTRVPDYQGRPNAALDFNGFSSRIVVPDANELDLVGDFTISSWMKARTASAINNIITKHTAGPNNEGTWVLRVQQPLSVGFDASPFFDGGSRSPALPINQWVHVTWTFRKSDNLWAMYVNGQVSATGNRGYQVQDNSRPVTIGAEGADTLNPPFGGFFDGALDDIRIYRRYMVPSEVAELAGARATISGTVMGATPSELVVVQIKSGEELVSSFSANNGVFTSPPVLLNGTYSISAFVDANRDGIYQFNERTGSWSGNPITLTVPITDVIIPISAPLDTDGDGMVDAWERHFGMIVGSDDSQVDKDGDGLSNGLEFQLGADPSGTDTDGDGLSDGVEWHSYGSSPLLTETDGDGMDDAWEIANGFNPLINDAAGDLDLDGLTNKEEYDRRGEGYRANAANSRAGQPDDDGMSDYRRLRGEGWVRRSYDKNDRLISTERDTGIAQLYEYDGNSQKVRDVLLPSLDTDRDGLSDAWEFRHGLAFTGVGAATGNNGAQGDPDGDGFTNQREWLAGTDPRNASDRPQSGPVFAGSVLSAAAFMPTNWLMTTGQADGFGAEELFVAADGVAGTAANEIRMLTKTGSGWMVESIPAGLNGVTSLAFGIPAAGYGPAIYAGTRPVSGPGTIAEFRYGGVAWSAPGTAIARSEGTGAAHVIGVSPNQGLLSRLSTEAASNGVFRQNISKSVTVRVPASATWGQLLSGSPDAAGQSQLGNDQQFARWVTATGSQRALLKFQLPAGQARITGITLNLKATSANAGEEVKVHRLTNSAFTGGATWNKLDGTTAWNTPGGDYAAGAVATVPSASWVANSVNSIALDATGISWGDPVGLVIKRTTEGANSGVGASWSSPGATQAADRPYLEVTIIPGDSGSWTPPALVDGISGSAGWPTLMNSGAGRWIDTGEIRYVGLGNVPTPDALPGAIRWPTTGNWYFLTPTAMTWAAAEQFAVAKGGHLVTVNDEAENLWIAQQFGSSNPWIGLYREPNSSLSSGWKWSSGSQSSYRRWGNGEPNDAGGPNNELTVQTSSSGLWNDGGNASPLRAVVEWSPEIELATLSGLPAASKVIWRGRSMTSGVLRISGGNGNSLCAAFLDDTALPSGPSTGDDFVVGEYEIGGTTPVLRSTVRIPLVAAKVAGAYGLAIIRRADTTKPGTLVVGEPDGTVSFWTAPDATAPLVRKVFSNEFAGKAWHQMEPLKEADGREGLVGLLVDPATPNQCQVIHWSPEALEAALTGTAPVLNHAPLARVLPVPATGGARSTVGVRIWDAEAHASRVVMQVQRVGETTWGAATVLSFDGGAAGTAVPLSTMPGGVNHTLEWNAAADLGATFDGTVLLRVQATDSQNLTGAWSDPMRFAVNVGADLDSDGDGATDAAEAAFGTNPNAAGSRPTVEAELNLDGTITFTWPTAAGRTYRLETSTTLNTWTPVESGLGAGTWTIPQPPITGGDRFRFYRVVAE